MSTDSSEISVKNNIHLSKEAYTFKYGKICSIWHKTVIWTLTLKSYTLFSGHPLGKVPRCDSIFINEIKEKLYIKGYFCIIIIVFLEQMSFPENKLKTLEEKISHPRWVVPVLPEQELEALLLASTELAAKG